MVCFFPGVDLVALICSSYHRVYYFVRFKECNGRIYVPGEQGPQIELYSFCEGFHF